jgi:malonyl CoA-acyl carrier protein transacylase
LSEPIAVVFPGQGSQRPGMGRDFHDRFAVSREAYAEASDALGLDVAKVCFDEDPRLDETEYTQPCILTTEVAMYRALERELGLSAAYFGGHSLGEYSALCAAGFVSLADAARLTRKRGALMQRAVPRGEGAMLAVIAKGVAERDLHGELAPFGVDVANLNSSEQVVLSGAAPGVKRAGEHLAKVLEPGHRLVELNVSAPFHSRLMRPIEPEFAEELAGVMQRLDARHAPRCTSNVSGGFHEGSAGTVTDALTRQISSPVDWVGNMQVLAAAAPRILEVGPGRPLSAFFRTIGRNVGAVVSVKHAERELAPAAAGA